MIIKFFLHQRDKVNVYDDSRAVHLQCFQTAPTPVLGRNEKLMNCHIKELNDKCHKGNIHSGKQKVSDYPFLYIYLSHFIIRCVF